MIGGTITGLTLAVLVVTLVVRLAQLYNELR